MMHKFPFPQRFYFSFLGRVLAAAYGSERRRVLRLSLAAWTKWVSFGLLLLALFLRLPNRFIWFLLALFLIIQFSYWLAGRMGYKRFVMDKTAVSPQDSFAILPPEQKTAVRASGVFAVKDRDEMLLLCPAEYWRAALGENIVMVRDDRGGYLYQFFNAATLRHVKKGWLIFGKTPLDTLALTIQNGWDVSDSEPSESYYVRGEEKETKRKLQKQTIYFTFADEEALQQVWGSLVNLVREA